MGKISGIIKEQRILLGLRQKDLANLLNHKNSQLVSNWERDESLPSPQSIKNLAQSLEMDYKHLALALIEDVFSHEAKKIIDDFGFKKVTIHITVDGLLVTVDNS
jgi:transcriptional regulator with XRE-family HTH domain